jgi:Cyclin, N-terminal domain
MDLSTMEAMLRLEDAWYTKGEYLSRNSKDLVVPKHENGDPCPSAACVDVRFRRDMIQWYYHVYDHCKFNRETVETIASYLDRFCWKSSPIKDRKNFQLCAITCLYIAVKIHESDAMHPRTLTKLSRDTYTEQNITDMEITILSTLNWKLNPPTSLAFVRQMFQLLIEMVDIIMDEGTERSLFEVIRIQTEIATIEYNLITIKSSVIAFCAILNSFEIIKRENNLPCHTPLQRVRSYLSETIGISCSDPTVCFVKRQLYNTTMAKLHPTSIICRDSTLYSHHPTLHHIKELQDNSIMNDSNDHKGSSTSPRCSMKANK